MSRERRVLAIDLSEMRVVDDVVDAAPRIVGYAAVFGRRSENMGGFVEVIKPGAFAEAVANSDVRGLFNHDPNYLLGRTGSGTLAVTEDEMGLRFELEPPQTQTIRDLVLAPIQRGDLTGCSFAFTVAKGGDAWAEQKDGTYLRTIGKVARLYDISVVTYPAYPATSLACRSAMEVFGDFTAEQRALREAEEIERQRALRQSMDVLTMALELEEV